MSNNISNIKVQTTRTHTITHRLRLSEADIKQAIASHIAKFVGVGLGQDNVFVKVLISTRDKGTAGFESEAEVVVTEDLSRQVTADEKELDP